MNRYGNTVLTWNFYKKLKHKKCYQFRGTKEFYTNVYVGGSLKKIEPLFFCEDSNIEEGE